MIGKYNIAIGFLSIGFFMVFGFLLLSYRDNIPLTETYNNNYRFERHFETRLAHIHGNLFGFLNVIIGYFLIRFHKNISYPRKISLLALIGLLMPFGVIAETLFNFSPLFTLIGAVSMTTAVVWLGLSLLTTKKLII